MQTCTIGKVPCQPTLLCSGRVRVQAGHASRMMGLPALCAMPALSARKLGMSQWYSSGASSQLPGYRCTVAKSTSGSAMLDPVSMPCSAPCLHGRDRRCRERHLRGRCASEAETETRSVHTRSPRELTRTRRLKAKAATAKPGCTAFGCPQSKNFTQPLGMKPTYEGVQHMLASLLSVHKASTQAGFIRSLRGPPQRSSSEQLEGSARP